MRLIMKLSGCALALAAICLAVGAEPVQPQGDSKAVAKAARKSAAKNAKKSAVPPADKAAPAAAAAPVAAEKNSADEQAIRETAETFASAYNKADAKAVAAHFTPDGEYVDEQGNVFQGRQAIEDSLTDYFIENPGSRLEVAGGTIRFVSAGVAIEEGTTTVTHPDGVPSDCSRFTAVHVKINGKWLTASSFEHAAKELRQHSLQLQQLEWLVGDWVDEDDDSIVEFTCQPIDDGNFLLRQFIIKISGQEAMTGTQRIGWDPISGKLRAWVFDSDGGYSEGTWHRNGDSWIAKMTGVTSDGQVASGTSIYTFISEHIMTWQAVDHEIAGVALPDSDVIIIVRRPPPPEESDADSTQAKN